MKIFQPLFMILIFFCIHFNLEVLRGGFLKSYSEERQLLEVIDASYQK